MPSFFTLAATYDVYSAADYRLTFLGAFYIVLSVVAMTLVSAFLRSRRDLRLKKADHIRFPAEGFSAQFQQNPTVFRVRYFFHGMDGCAACSIAF